MSPKSLTVMAGLAALAVVGAAPPAPAQTAQTPLQQIAGPPPPPRAHPPRIEVNPRPLLYRRCVDWYVLKYRPSGTVLFPEQHCWWVRG
ncbi:MAG TPA: hypothetical protein VJX48_06635 [Xanthobacteraceae bacterium]|nr:hypothetical protein [Xanthobacteraceae bacterium]